MFKEFTGQFTQQHVEQEMLKFWDANQIFRKSVETRDKNKNYVFYEGPPTANGTPGIHHVISRTIKDFVCRYKTMQDYHVERKAGWDTHGLPVEIEVEKALGIDGKEQVLEYGVDKFNQKCKESVFKYKKEWDDLTRKIGFWIDLENPYITYENSYIESVWWILKEFWKRDFIYRGYQIIPYCPRCETPLSSHEVAQGYEDVEDPSIYVKIQLKTEPDTYFLIWTTTPWTLISNVALAFNLDMDYVKVIHEGQKLILASQRIWLFAEDLKFWRIIKARSWLFWIMSRYLHLSNQPKRLIIQSWVILSLQKKEPALSTSLRLLEMMTTRWD